MRIGVFRDEALSFYYPENLEALEEAGATLVFISPLADRTLPEVDALYFGGGFPEVHVDRLANNGRIREAVRSAAADGMPVYAECGGLMFLARELIVDGKKNIYICEMGRAATDGSFQRFMERIGSARVRTCGLNVVYDSPSQGELKF